MILIDYNNIIKSERGGAALWSKFKEFLKHYWNVYGTLLLSLMIAEATNFSQILMDSITSFIVLFLTIFSVLTFIKKLVYKDKVKTTIIEKASLHQSSVKALNTVVDPEETGQEIGLALVETKKIIERIGNKNMKALKSVGKFLNTYKGAITSIILFLCTTAVQVIDVIEGTFTGLMGTMWFNIMQTTSIGCELIIGIVSYGWGSPALKEKIAELKDQLDGDSVEQVQFINDKKFLEKQEKIYTEQVKSVEKELITLDNSYVEQINEYESCKRLGLAVDNDTSVAYNEYLAKKQTCEQKLQNKKIALETYKQKLDELLASELNAKK